MVSERRWHPSQRIKWLGKKESDLKMVLELSSFEEIRRWILSWGAQVEVLEPAELRTSIREESENVRSVYKKTK